MRLKRAVAVFVVTSSLLSILTCVLFMKKLRGQVSLASVENRSYSMQTMNTKDERQWKRMEDLKNGCKNTSKTPLRRSDLSHLIVDDSHQLVYCYVPKVACTSWKKIMAALNGFPNQTGPAVHRRDQKRLRFLAKYPESKIKLILQTYLKFMFVREPFERLLSAYKDKFVKGDEYIMKKYGSEIIRLRTNTKLDAWTRDANITFVEFINYVIFLGKYQLRFNEHWRTYESLCRPCAINYDFIGHYETMVEDAAYILKRAGVEHLVAFPPFRQTNTAGELLSYYSRIPQNALLQLQRIYQIDLDMFGYRFPGPLASLFRA